MRERDAIARLRKMATDPAARGLRDDVALLDGLVLTHDTIAEGVHFRPDDPPGHAPFWRVVRAGMLDVEPPDHPRLSRLVSRAFTPRTVERLRPVVQSTTDALVDQVQLAVGAGTRQGAGIPDAVARTEQRHLGADGAHDAARIPAEHARLGLPIGRQAAAHLGVDRVHGYRVHLDQDVVAGGDR